MSYLHIANEALQWILLAILFLSIGSAHFKIDKLWDIFFKAGENYDAFFFPNEQESSEATEVYSDPFDRGGENGGVRKNYPR